MTRANARKVEKLYAEIAKLQEPSPSEKAKRKAHAITRLELAVKTVSEAVMEAVGAGVEPGDVITKLIDLARLA